MTRDRLVLLGTKGGPAVRRADALPTASLLQIAGRTILVDCGLGVTRSLVAAGVDLRALDLIFITHLHSDHVLELGPLLHTAWTTGLARPVTVHGPPGIEACWRGFLDSMDFDNRVRVADEGRTPLHELIAVRTFGEGEVMTADGLRISALRVAHPPVDDCFALRIEAGDRAITFSADTAYFPPLASFARGSDVLVHEAMLAAGIEPIIAKTGLGEKLRQHLLSSHSTAAEAGRIAAAANVGHLVLHHLIPADDPDVTDADWQAEVATEWPGRLTVGRDGRVIPL